MVFVMVRGSSGAAHRLQGMWTKNPVKWKGKATRTFLLLLELDGRGDFRDGCYIREMDTPIIFNLLEKRRGSVIVKCNLKRGAAETPRWALNAFSLHCRQTLLCFAHKKCRDFHWYSLYRSHNHAHIHTFCFAPKSIWRCLLCIELQHEPRLYLLLH